MRKRVWSALIVLTLILWAKAVLAGDTTQDAAMGISVQSNAEDAQSLPPDEILKQGFCPGLPGRGDIEEVAYRLDRRFLRLARHYQRKPAYDLSLQRGGAVVALSGAVVSMVPLFEADCAYNCSNGLFTETTAVGFGIMAFGGMLAGVDYLVEPETRTFDLADSRRDQFLMPLTEAPGVTPSLHNRRVRFEALKFKRGGGVSMRVHF